MSEDGDMTLTEIRAALRECDSFAKTAAFLGLTRFSLRRRIQSRLPEGVTYRGFLRGDVQPAPYLHARARASQLYDAVTAMVTSTRWPVVNPEALVVRHRVETVYRDGEYVRQARSPRTWVTDTLRCAPVPDVRGRKFIVTGAQADTPVHLPFLRNLRAYARHLGAELIVTPWTYETSWFDEGGAAGRSFAPEIREDMCFGQLELGPGFLVMADINILPTAARPLSDLVPHTRGRWAVVPHAKRALQAIPSTDPSRPVAHVMTSCAVTRPHVIPRKAGQKALFHHVIGAVLIEFDAEGRPFCRQLSADEEFGTFYDVSPQGLVRVASRRVRPGGRPTSLVVGDLHVAKLTPTVPLNLFGVDIRDGSVRNTRSLVDVLRPEAILLHDGFDNESRNHHHAKDPGHNYAMAYRGRDDVAAEVRGLVNFLGYLARFDARTLVVESNHDLGLARYITEGRYRMDGLNYRFGLETELLYVDWLDRQCQALDRDEAPPPFSMLEAACRQVDALPHVSWLYDGTSHLVDGVEVAHHGFRGAGGAKGTTNGFTRMGVRMTIGDKHQAAILDGVYQAGVCQLEMGYNKGPATWSVSHVIQYPDGKRAILTMQDGAWCADVPAVRPASAPAPSRPAAPSAPSRGTRPTPRRSADHP